MKYYTFRRKSNDFSDILTDAGLKKHIDLKMSWDGHLLIGFVPGTSDQVLGYLVLKYSDDIVNPFDRDFTPVPGKDYIPKKM